MRLTYKDKDYAGPKTYKEILNQMSEDMDGKFSPYEIGAIIHRFFMYPKSIYWFFYNRSKLYIKNLGTFIIKNQYFF